MSILYTLIKNLLDSQYGFTTEDIVEELIQFGYTEEEILIEIKNCKELKQYEM